MSNDTKVEANIKVNEVIKKEDFEFILETITYLKLWLILAVLIIVKIIIIKSVKKCKKFYTAHNERIIRQHSTTTLEL